MDFYYMDVSSPCRSVMLTAKTLGIEFNRKEINVFEGQHLKPEFVAINFQHVIPTLVDGDLTLWESRAICTYLASKYGKDDALYPKEPQKRALVDRMLYVDFTLLDSLAAYAHPIVIEGKTEDLTAIENVDKNLGFLNKFLECQDYAVGNDLTVADHCLAATVSSIEAIGIDVAKHSNVAAWFERCKANMDGYDNECGIGAKQCGEVLHSKLKENERKLKEK